MSVVSVRARSFILALFIRDDGERFLLGDNGFDFKDSQLHFSANTIENDEVVKQGVDGVMLAGQVRRASVQSFDGYVGDATTLKEEVEQMRRDFIAFFAKGHHFRVIYIDCNRNAWQRKGGYLVDAPEVKELWQIHPEYHVGLNFEDVNYYEYDENAEGEEILSNIISVPISSDVEGGLVWDENGAVSEPAVIEYDTETATASGTNISISDAVEAPLSDFKLKGETSQNGTPTPDAPVPVKVVTGKNVVKICGKNLFDKDTATVLDGYFVSGAGAISATAGYHVIVAPCEPNTTYTLQWSKVSPDGQNRCRIGASSTAVTPSTTGMTILASNTSSYLSPLTITTPADAHYLAIDLRGFSATSPFSDILESLQLEKGSATDYEPYQGQDYEINLGKNLFNKDNVVQGIPQISDGSIGQTTGTGRTCQFIPVMPNTQYTHSGHPQGWAVIAYYRADKSFISRVGNVTTITTPSDCFYVSVSCAVGDLSTCQFELGSQATSYAPYFTPIELCKIGDYQDYIYKDGSDWKIHKAVNRTTLTGSEGWYDAGGNAPYGLVIDDSLITTSDDNPPLVYCDKFYPVSQNASWNKYNSLISSSSIGSSTKTIRIRYTGVADLPAFQTWLGSNNTILYYVLAAPADEEITNEALLAQLEAILSQGYTYAGTNNITTVISAGNAQGELEITYYTKYDAKVVGGGYVWEAGGSGGPTIVTNESISAVSPVWTVFGPALNPMLENTTTGEQIQYVGMIGEGQTLVVDMGEQTARLDGLNVISNIVGEYLTLAPGSNTLLFSAEGDAPASEIGWSEIVG